MSCIDDEEAMRFVTVRIAPQCGLYPGHPLRSAISSRHVCQQGSAWRRYGDTHEMKCGEDTHRRSQLLSRAGGAEGAAPPLNSAYRGWLVKVCAR